VKTLDPWVEVLPSGFQRTFCAFRTFPVVTGRGTPRGVRGPPHHAEPASFAAPQGYGAAGRLLRPPVSSPARFHRLPRLLRRPRRSVRPFGVEPGSALFTLVFVFTTSRRSSRLRTVYTTSRLRFLSHRCHVAALGRSCSGRPDVEDVVLPLEPAGSLTFQGYSAQRSPPGDHLNLF
jgi:hypothetical protein